MTKLAMIALFTATLAMGCKKKQEEAGTATATGTTAASGKEGSAAAAPTPTDPAKPADPAAAGTATGDTAAAAGGTAAAGAAKAEYKAEEIWKEASAMGNMERTEKYPNGVTVSGTVKSIKDDPTGEYVVTFDATGGNTVDAMIMDPAAAKEKKLKAGDTVTLKNCSIANTQGTSMPLRNCEYKP